jgi:hypothetical protein
MGIRLRGRPRRRPRRKLAVRCDVRRQTQSAPRCLSICGNPGWVTAQGDPATLSTSLLFQIGMPWKIETWFPARRPSARGARTAAELARREGPPPAAIRLSFGTDSRLIQRGGRGPRGYGRGAADGGLLRTRKPPATKPVGSPRSRLNTFTSRSAGGNAVTAAARRLRPTHRQTRSPGLNAPAVRSRPTSRTMGCVPRETEVVTASRCKCLGHPRLLSTPPSDAHRTG